jgi:hypothetical protein
MTEYRTDWRNIGAWLEFRFHRSFGIRTPWGNFIVKRWSDRLFSERYTTSVPQLKLGPLCLSWRRLRKSVRPSPLTEGKTI